MVLVVDPNTGRLVDEKELGKTKQQRDNKEDINVNLYDGKDETDIQLDNDTGVQQYFATFQDEEFGAGR